NAQGDAVRHSVPVELVRYWQCAYGKEVTDGLLAAVNLPPPQYLRVNTLKISVEDFTKRLADANVPFTVHPDLPAGIHIPAGIDWKGLAKTEENWYYYQDTASQYCCFALGAKADEQIADVCAAPGGKSFTVAQYMQNKGRILAGDIYPAKCDTIETRAEMFGITCIQTVVRDASKPVPAALKGQFDRVLCDAPCSGFGVIRRKPEIRYKSLADFKDLPKLQLEILSRAAEMVKSGGVLQYSTCTLRVEENEQVAAAFLETHPDFVPRVLPLDVCFEKAGLAPSHYITLFPHIHETDGFFIASFRKK
ncbi:MAG: 16S rRNA (cytosine(967)-C(5))-methyltransferase RsmB, partial [Clostridia bacterium]|nr:16S rRNA (cytosine(967)-C(5))-methyltransferase RsmB [Clostridia bacterium]